MDSRRKVLELFDRHKDEIEKRTAEGIEKYRKGNAKITVTDQNGDPVPNARLCAKQRTHEFRFGANLFMLDELESQEKNSKYEAYFADVFNMATLPFYWDALEPERNHPRYDKASPKVYRRPSPDLCLEFCEKHGIEPREHALAYEGFFPKWLYKAGVDEVKRELERRYREISERYAHRIRTIEVTNELEWEKGKTAFYEEPDFLQWCFQLADRYFPNNQLVINENTDRCWRDRGRTTDKYYAYTEACLLKGTRIDAVGMQYHLFHTREEEYEATRTTLDPQKLYRHLDLYGRFGKPLQITEVTVPAYSWEPEDEQIQAQILEKLYGIWFSHPNVEQIIYWNLVDGYAHLWDADPDKIRASQGDMSLGENYYHGGLLRFDLTPKPAYEKIKELIQNTWHTQAETYTNTAGVAAFRGFYGAYDLQITAGGKTVTAKMDLSAKSDNQVRISL